MTTQSLDFRVLNQIKIGFMSHMMQQKKKLSKTAPLVGFKDYLRLFQKNMAPACEDLLISSISDE